MFWCDFVAGWVGGCSGILVGHPFDTLKVRQQSLTNAGLAEVTKSCLRNEGFTGLFKGMSYPLWSAGILNSLFFGVYGVTLRKLAEQGTFRTSKSSATAKPNYAEIFCAGVAGGAAQLIVSCPVDLVKIKLQTQISDHAKYRSPFHVLKSIYGERGVRGWYKGAVPMAWRDLKASAIYMMLYSNFLDKVGSKDSKSILLAGGMAGIFLPSVGVISWLSIIYLDVVKSRIQADDPTFPKYQGMVDCFRQCYKEGGIKIFTRGALAVSIRAFPLNGATFLGYEYVLASCQKFHREQE